MTTSPRVSRKIAPTTVPTPSYRTRLSLQPLEDRVTPAMFLVNTATDVVDPNDGVLSLREAIQQSNAGVDLLNGGNLITFSESLSNKSIILSNGELEITGRVIIRGLGANRLTINGNNQSRIFNIYYLGGVIPEVEISGLTLTGGRDTQTNSILAGGGAIRNEVNLVLKDLNLIHNSALGFGGAIYHQGIFSLNIQNCTLSGNFAQEGGGIYATSERLSFSEDSTSSGQSQTFQTPITIQGSTIRSNSAVNGGGIRVDGIQLSIESSSILSNIASSIGGGISASGSTLSIWETTISFNSAINGGGISCFPILTFPFSSSPIRFAPSLLNLTNSTVSQNVARSAGGGLVLYPFSGSVILQSTITGNRVTEDIDSASAGGGIYNVPLIVDAVGPLPQNRVVNSIVSGNFVGSDNRPGDFGGAPLIIQNENIEEQSPPIQTNNTTTVNNPNPVTTTTPAPQEPETSTVPNTVPASPNPTPTGFNVAIGSSPGTIPSVQIFDAITGAFIKSIQPYSSAFTGGVHVALGDINNDGTPDIITGVRSAGSPHIKVFDGKTGAVLRSFYAFDVNFIGGVFLASADINNDGFDDIVVSAGNQGAPHVKVFSGKDGAILKSFFAYDVTMTAGVRVATGDVNGDGFAEIITSPGAGVGPHVKVFDGKTGSVVNQFFAYDARYNGGVFVTVDDRNGDGMVEILTGADSGANPHIKVFNGKTGRVQSSFFQDPTIILLGIEVQNSPSNPNLIQPAQFLEPVALRFLNNFEAFPTLLDRAAT